MKKRIISLLMCLVMAFSIVPAASASTNNAEDDRPLAGHLLLPTAGKSGIIGIYETLRKEYGL